MKSLASWLTAEILGGSRVDSTSGPYSKITADSRDAGPGSLFFCIRGTQVDGHKFAAEVAAKGAKTIVVEDRSLFEQLPNTILVRNTREAYARACADWFGFPGRKLKTVAVTGTNGKTTTTFLTAELLERVGWRPGLIGTVVTKTGRSSSQESNMTTPDAFHVQKSIAEMVTNGLDSLAIEATSIALDQHRLTGTPIEVAAFTNLTQDHLDYHKTWERYYEAKRMLFFEMNPRKCLINVDDEWGRRLAKELAADKSHVEILTYSANGAGADLTASNLVLDSKTTSGTLRWQGQKFSFRTAFIGQHNVANVLTAVGAGLALGISPEELIAGLPQLKGAPGRLERVPLPQGAPQVFVDYAHTPDAIEKAAQTLRDVRAPHGRLITVFGAGGDRDKTKRPLMAQAAAKFSDLLIITSDNPRTENPDAIVDDVLAGLSGLKPPFHREVDRRKAIALALAEAGSHDLVLIAGKGHETYQILGRDKVDFDDRKVAAEAYRTRTR